ncbi:unnamed protein product [Cylindrotheca closterium]|uniref:RING-type domain-containing protein n=1 Tax=Cylindrotheca closterium TaxID=2856 RepID=A0AAD2G2W5_9STRA|nr:unnamed protein product [Cylindrotheca closterium]
MSSNEQTEVLQTGMRITCYWPDDDQWYKGTVAEKLDDDRFKISYDDGDEGEINAKEDKWRRSLHNCIKENTLIDEKKEALINKLEVGSRISVYFPYEKEYYAGSLTKKRDVSAQKGRHRIKYDDGDIEWTDLLFRKFKRITKKSEGLKVGSRVAVYDEKRKKNYHATVVKIKPGRVRPHKVKYDKESRGKEWLNLHIHPFLDVVVERQNGMKRKEEIVFEGDRPIKRRFHNSTQLEQLMQHDNETEQESIPQEAGAHSTSRVEREIQQDNETEPASVPASEEPCAHCKTCTDAPYATSCHHIFCELCIGDHMHGHGKCPLCKIPIRSAPVPFSPDHDSFKAIEALSRKTAEVELEFSSASAASIKVPGFKAARIIEACQSKRRDDREHRGYYWRFKGSKDRILRVGEGVKEGVPIEQVDLETGEIIKTFSSGRKAHEATGISRVVIKRVLERRGKANGGGFFWRYQGETHAPWPDPEPTNLNPVEQLDPESGEVLASFKSLAAAKRAMGMPMNRGCIRDVCNGDGRGTANGFFWRWKGSTSMSHQLMGGSKFLEIRKKRDGKVLKVFKNSKEAQAFFGHQSCWSSICRYCREEGFYLGYYWRYRVLRKPLSSGEAVVGKRLRIKQGDGKWLEGKIKSFRSDSGEHEIEFDSGKTERHRLEHLEYEWKNDQGQKPIEQLDLQTGQILNTFDSISDASRGIEDASASRITAVCKGRYNSAHGYFWRYKGSTALPRKNKGRRKIDQLCLKTGRVIATFDTITDAGKAVGITTPGISYCCNGRNGSKSAGGFGWKFSTEDEEQGHEEQR